MSKPYERNSPVNIQNKCTSTTVIPSNFFAHTQAMRLPLPVLLL